MAQKTAVALAPFSARRFRAPRPSARAADDERSRLRWLYTLLSLSLALAGPVCAMITYVLISAPDASPTRGALRIMLIVDFCVAVALIGLIGWRIAALVLARRKRSAGSRLHLRMVRLFAALAVAPVLVLGLFSAFMVTVGLQGWISDRVKSVVRNSAEISRQYANERRNDVALHAIQAAAEISDALRSPTPDREALIQVTRAVAERRGLAEMFVINGMGDVLARGGDAFLFLYDRPSEDQLAVLRNRAPVHIFNHDTDEVTGLAPIPGMLDAYLYVSSPVPSEVADRIIETEALIRDYQAIEEGQVNLLLIFAVLYVGFAFLVVGAAIWFGIWFADRLSRPVGRLAAAAGKLGEGDMDARVPEERGKDEIALLSRVFNRMADQVQGHHAALVAANEELDERGEFLRAVLSGVSAGVLGVDGEGRVTVANYSAEALLGRTHESLKGQELAKAAPALCEIVDRASRSLDAEAEGRASILSGATEIELMVRASRLEDGEGYVVTFDDMTDLVSAQRMAAWADVARRVAHEIKNPLTPIQLSAERLKRKFAKTAGPEQEAIEGCVDTIVRQVADIRRMVDEFSRFARMPEPELAPVDLAAAAEDVVELQKGAHPGVSVTAEIDAMPAGFIADRGLITQALTNLVKNAAEAVTARLEMLPEPPGEVRLIGRREAGGAAFIVVDNGVGLPKLERRRLTEPYVTTRRKGTGLGLSIVKRIVEQHGGRLTLDDADPFAPDAPRGAMAKIFLPARDAAAEGPEPETAAMPVAARA